MVLANGPGLAPRDAIVLLPFAAHRAGAARGVATGLETPQLTTSRSLASSVPGPTWQRRAPDSLDAAMDFHRRALAGRAQTPAEHSDAACLAALRCQMVETIAGPCRRQTARRKPPPSGSMFRRPPGPWPAGGHRCADARRRGLARVGRDRLGSHPTPVRARFEASVVRLDRLSRRATRWPADRRTTAPCAVAGPAAIPLRSGVGPASSPHDAEDPGRHADAFETSLPRRGRPSSRTRQRRHPPRGAPGARVVPAVRCLLPAREPVLDETGWTLATTPAAAALMALLRANLGQAPWTTGWPGSCRRRQRAGWRRWPAWRHCAAARLAPA